MEPLPLVAAVAAATALAAFCTPVSRLRLKHVRSPRALLIFVAALITFCVAYLLLSSTSYFQLSSRAATADPVTPANTTLPPVLPPPIGENDAPRKEEIPSQPLQPPSKPLQPSSDQEQQQQQSAQPPVGDSILPSAKLNLPAFETVAAERYMVLINDRFNLISGNLPPPPTHTTYKEALANYTLGNVGNFVWQYGAIRGLPDFSRTITCNETRAVCLRALAAHPTADRLIDYRPVANFFHMNRQSDFEFDNFLVERENIFPLYIGMGSQEHFSLDPDKHDLIPGARIETRPEDFKFRPGGSKILRALQKNKFPMLVRGDFTRDATRSFGYDYAISNGCPSMFISRDVHLGRTLHPKYEALGKRIGDMTLKVAINIKNSPHFIKLYLDLLQRYPNAMVYAQGNSDFRVLQISGVPLSRMRFFTTVEQWRESIAEMDVSIGGRIHGSMVALSVGVPVFIIAPDHRVLELAQSMKLPHWSGFDARVQVEGMDVAKVVGEAGFDGEAFDSNRCRLAQTFQHVLGRFGIGVQRHVEDIAGLC